MPRLDLITSNGDNFITSDTRQFRVVGPKPEYVPSFSVMLYENSDETHTVFKTLSAGKEYKGTLREGSSIVNPIILIEDPSRLKANYAYISDFNRYYFITDIISVNFNLWEVHMNCDVLMSYREGIRGLTARIRRSESIATWAYTDTLIPPQSGASITRRKSTITNPSTWSTISYDFGADEGWDLPSKYTGKGHLLLKIACSTLIVRLPDLIEPLGGYFYATCNFETMGLLIDRIRNLGFGSDKYNISDVILDIRWIPYTLPFFGKCTYISYTTWEGLSADSCYVGDLDMNITFDVARLKGRTTWRVTQPVDQIKYRNHSPFKDMCVEFIPFGTVPINSEIYGDTPNLDFIVETDLLTGSASLSIMRRGDSNSIKYLASADVSTPIDIISIQNQTGRLTSLLPSALSFIGSVATLDFKGAISSLTGAVDTVYNTSPRFNGVSGGGTGNALIDEYPTLVISNKTQENISPSLEGWVANVLKPLSQVRGFTTVSSVHIEGSSFRGSTLGERQEIERLLMSGVIFPR